MPAEILDLSVDLEVGPGRQIDKRLADDRRKLVQITLRGGEVLAEHSALHPVTIHCVAGAGALTVGEQRVHLAPGVVACLDPGVRHAVFAEPAVSILVSFFRPGGST